MKKNEKEYLTLPTEIIFEKNIIKNIKYKNISKKIFLEELYLLLLSNGPGYRNNLEFWDPTLDAIILAEELDGSKTKENNKEKNKK